MDIKGFEWYISDRKTERLGVNITIVKADGTKETKNIRLDGNVASAAYWGLYLTLQQINELLGYKFEFKTK